MATQEGTQNPVYLTITTGIGIAGDLAYDMLKAALQNATFDAKLAALVPGAQLWVVKNIGNTIEIGLGLANGDINQVGKAVMDLLAETAIGGATDALITGIVTGATGGNIEIAEPFGIAAGIVSGVGTSLFGVGDSLWNDIVNSSGKNAILNLGFTQIEFSLTSTPQILSSGGIVSTSSSTQQVTQTLPQDSLTNLVANNGQSLSPVTSTAADGSTITTTYSGNNANVTTSKGFQESFTFSADGSTITSDIWSNAIGTNGTDTYNTDGSSSSTVTYADGNYATTLDDGQGNITTDYYTKDGVEIRSTWVHSDGSSGTVALYADGQTQIPGAGADAVPPSSFTVLQNPDGTYTATGWNAQDGPTTIQFDANGNQTSPSTSTDVGINDQTVAGSTTAYIASFQEVVAYNDNAAGAGIGDSWYAAIRTAVSTPTPGSWIGSTPRQPAGQRPTRRGQETGRQEIDHFVAQYNKDCKPFVWAATADSTLESFIDFANESAEQDARQRSVADYFLSPLMKTAEESLHER